MTFRKFNIFLSFFFLHFVRTVQSQYHFFWHALQPRRFNCEILRPVPRYCLRQTMWWSLVLYEPLVRANENCVRSCQVLWPCRQISSGAMNEASKPPWFPHYLIVPEFGVYVAGDNLESDIQIFSIATGQWLIPIRLDKIDRAQKKNNSV